MDNTVIITIIDEVKCTVKGLPRSILEKCHDKFAEFVAGYQFSAKYKVGMWTGKHHFFSMGGQTYVYLIPKIIKYLKNLGYSNIKFKDQRQGLFYNVDVDNITEDYFEHIIFKKTGNPVKLLPHQLEGAKALLKNGSGIGLAATSYGKAQLLSSKVLTPNGWSTIGDIQVNDLIMTPKNTISKVLGKYPQGITKVYKIEFDDGGHTYASPEHLFKVYNIDWIKKFDEPFNLFTVERIKEILDTTKKDVYVPSIPVPLNFKKYDYIIPPYFAGSILPFVELIDDKLIITEQSSSTQTMSELLMDNVIDVYREYNIRLKFFKKAGTNKCSELIASDDYSQQLLNAVKSFIKNKIDIPEEYILCDINDRLKFIQGMCDIGGVISPHGQINVIVKNKHIKDQIREMLLLHGCSLDKRNANDSKKSETTIYFSHKNPDTFFTIMDKKEIFYMYSREQLHNVTKISKNRKIKSIEYYGEEETCCIMIEDFDHLYITDDCIITHNTILNAVMVDAYAKKGCKTLTIVPRTSLVKQTIEQFKELGLDVHHYTSKTPSLEHDHIVSTWQTLQHVPHIMSQFQMVVVDECISGESLITMIDGTKKKIKDIVANDEIISYNGSTFEDDIVVKVHKNLVKSSDEKMYRLEFDNGLYLECTGNHMIMTINGYVRADCLNDEEIIGI